MSVTPASHIAFILKSASGAEWPWRSGAINGSEAAEWLKAQEQACIGRAGAAERRPAFHDPNVTVVWLRYGVYNTAMADPVRGFVTTLWVPQGCEGNNDANDNWTPAPKADIAARATPELERIARDYAVAGRPLAEYFLDIYSSA